MGIYLDREGLLPWLWSRGGVAVEEKIFDLLPAQVERFGSKTYDWGGGSVVFSPIKIPWQTAEDFTLDADAVIKKTKQALEVISPKFIGDFLDGW